jgi:hypothetical protein
VKLLLDEHFSRRIAVALRRRGHDVVAVAERDDLRCQADVSILAAAGAEGRVVVTEDVADFLTLGARRLPDRRQHRGVVLVPHPAFPRHRPGIGRLTRALEALLVSHPGDDDLIGSVFWLKRAPGDPD